METETATVSAPRLKGTFERLRDNIAEVVRGKNDVIDDVLICLAAGGHVLMEDLPGLGKTTLAYCLARSIDCGFSRIQFTSDLLPSDVVGVSIYDEREHAFVFRRGPIFANIVLADEINRATPKTQSALLEVMDRGKVSVDGETHAVGTPFIVFATQNPVDFEGTFPLPESQMDRFLMRLRMGYPAHEFEMEILSRQNSRDTYDALTIEPVVTADEIDALQQAVPQVFAEDTVLAYILAIVTATRTEAEFEAGVSTRGALALKSAAQARALSRGRAFVLPEDVATVVIPVLTHRLSLARHVTDPLEERRAVEATLTRIVDSLPQPL